jgi:hypothetical protein
MNANNKIPTRIGLLLAALPFAGFLNLHAQTAIAQEQTHICAFSNEPKPSLFVDAWSKDSDRKILRFGSTENSDETLIQNCKNIDGKFIALSIGNREAGLASDTADILFREDLALNRCFISQSESLFPQSLKTLRDELKIKRLRTLRACVSLEITSGTGQPLQIGQHPTCKWKKINDSKYIGHGATCTVKIHRAMAISVRPVIHESCLDSKKWDSSDIQPADLDTLLQAVVSENETAEFVSQTIGIARRRIVFANSPTQSPPDHDSEFRFANSLGIEALPVNAEIVTERAHDGVTSFISMSLLLKNMGEWFNSHVVPIAAEAELFESLGDGRSRTISTWLAYSTGQTLAPADWMGLFTINRVAIPDFAFKNGKRYRIRLKFLHPSDVPGLIKSDMEQSAPQFEQTPSSFQTQLFPRFNMVKRTPSLGGFPTMGKSHGESVSNEQMTAIERNILRFFRSLGVDAEFPRRYQRGCVNGNCARVDRVTYIGEAYFDFTSEAIPGQVGAFNLKGIKSASKMIYQPEPIRFEGDSGASVQCP